MRMADGVNFRVTVMHTVCITDSLGSKGSHYTAFGYKLCGFRATFKDMVKHGITLLQQSHRNAYRLP